ncbi:MAG: hypothetical protein Q8K82_11165 [Gemmatimonadaceae bacterium]|nr:hypothetical protein [Gemmatimonadaceae bacterium]
MSDNVASIDDIPESEEIAPPAPAPRRGPGHRGQDVRDTMAEMAAKAHEISLEAGSKMAGTMREVIGAAAGLTAFAIESARDLVQYMVRRGQMTQDEADKLMREVEAAHASLPKVAPKAEPSKVDSAPKKMQSPTAAPVSVSPSALVPSPPIPVAVPALAPMPVAVELQPTPPKLSKVSQSVKPAVTTSAAKVVVDASKSAKKVATTAAAPLPPKIAVPAKPIAKPTVKPIVKPTVKPIAKPMVKPVAKPMVKAIVKVPTKPTAKTPTKPLAKGLSKPAAKAPAKPAAKKPVPARKK